MRIALIGTGVSGLVCAHRLNRRHDLTVFEAAEHIGGHTHTVDVASGGRLWPVDTGFIVFNERAYPRFVQLLDELGVASRPTRMTFSVRCERTGLEYSGRSLNGLLAQRVVHTDPAVMPRRRRAWAAWNFHALAEAREGVAVTYHMNALQGLDAPDDFFVTLNYDAPLALERVVKRITWHHPVFTPEAVAAQARWPELNGRERISYCGAYWGYGFHEDGVRSGLAVCDALEARA